MSKYREQIVKMLKEAEKPMESQLKCAESCTSCTELFDEILKKKASKLKFQDYAYNREELSRILSRFFTFYLTGMIKPGDNVVATICDTIALARDPKELIFEAGHSEQKVFYSANSSDMSNLELPVLGAMPMIHLPGNLKGKAAINAYQCTILNFSLRDGQEFTEYIKTMIEEIHSTNAPVKGEWALCQFAAFLALTLCRAAVIKKDLLSNAFMKLQYRRNLFSVVDWSQRNPYVPPCTRCLDISVAYLKKGQKIVSDLFTLLVHAYCVKSLNVAAGEFAMKFLLAAVLRHTKRDGLGLYELLEQVSHVTRLNWVIVMERTYNDTTKKSWWSLTKFFRTQRLKANPQNGVFWARIINPEYFQCLTIKKNGFLATVFASVIAHFKGDGIWKADWVTRYGQGLDEARVIGRSLFEPATKPGVPLT